MRIPGLGLEIRRQPKLRQKQVSLTSISSRGWWPVVREPSTGAWQRNQEISVDTVVTNPIVWACATLIAADIAKMEVGLVAVDDVGIKTPIESPAFSPILRKPNRFSTRIKFFEYWLLSKLLRGNTYALKSRDGRGVVTALYVLDPSNVTVLIAPDGSVFYQIGQDNLSGVESSFVAPAREIIHDIMVPMFHPLVGVSPIFACGAAAWQGLKIQSNTSKLVDKGTQLSGVLSSPHAISNEVAERLQKHWDANYAGESNAGKVAIVGDDLKFTPMTMTAVDAQLIEQLQWSDERICACFHVPGYMVGIGPAPPYTDIQSINLQYYTQALQNPIVNLEKLLTEGLELPKPFAVDFDEDSLARMDTKTKVENSTKGILGGLFKPNEERARFDRKPVAGGDTVYLQQQQYSLEALNARDTAPPTTPIVSPSHPTPDQSLKEAFVVMADVLREVAVHQKQQVISPAITSAPEPAIDKEQVEDMFRRELAA